MSRIVSCNTVKEYPDGNVPPKTLIIRNHWNYKDRVVFEIDGKTYVFIVSDLRMAIANAQNCHGF